MNWSLFSKPFSKFSVLLCCVFLLNSHLPACGISYPSDYFQVFFMESALLEGDEYSSFYYPWYYNYGDQLQNEMWNGDLPEEKDFESSNIERWHSYFNQKIAPKDLEEAIYAMDFSVYEALMAAAEKGGAPNLPDSIRSNALIQHLSKGKDKEALRYLHFAKQCEGWATLDRWWDAPNRDTEAMLDKIQEGMELRTSCPSGELKDRYAFQMIRLAHYGQKYDYAIELYDRFFGEDWKANEGSELLRQRSLLLKAGALKWEEEYGESMYWFARVFQEAPSLRTSAYHDFSFFSPLKFPEALPYAQNDDERAFLWALRGFQTDFPDLEAMENLAALNTDQQLLEVLLIRQLNLLEAEVMSPRLTQSSSLDQEKIAAHAYLSPQGEDIDFSFDPGTIPGYEDSRGFWQSIGDFFRGIWNWISGLFAVSHPQNPFYEPEAYRDEEIKEADLNQDKLLIAYRDFTKEQARSEQTQTPALWYLATAYIEFMRGQYPAAEGLLKNAKNEAKKGTKLASQIELLFVLNRIMDQGQVQKAQEKDLLAGMQWLDQMKEQHQNDRISNRVLTAIGQKYLAQGELIKGILCFSRANDELSFNVLCDIYADIEDLKTLRTKIEKGPEGPWEAYLLEGFPLDREAMQDLIGTRYLRTAKFEDAYREFKTLPESYWTEQRLDPNWQDYAWGETTTEPPAWAYFNDLKTFTVTFGTEEEIEAGIEPQTEEVSKMAFLEKVIDLEKQARENPEDAFRCYLKIARAFECTPFWGYAGVLWHGELAWQWQFYYSATQYPFNIPGFSTDLYIKEHQFLMEYGSPELAQLFYKKAMDATDDPELGAQACFAALSCEGEFHTSIHRYHEWETDMTWFELFHDRYQNTLEYELALKTCPNMSAYLNRAVN